MPRTPLLSVIIPAFNQWPLTRACLESLRAHTPGDFMEVVVVDNASIDETPRECAPLGAALFGERFRHLRMERNINFGPACNAGAAASRGELLLLLNNDTLLTPGWVGPLLAAFRADPRLAAAGPLLTYPGTGRVQHAGICFDLAMRPAHLYEHFPADHPAVRRRRAPQAITAAALAVPARLFESVGGFWPEYANGYEDMDLCARLRQDGRRLAVVAESRVEHLAGQSPGRFEREEANSRIFRERCAGSFAMDLHRVAARDGYEARLTPWLASVLTLPAERRSRIEAQADGVDDPRALAELLAAEPLWIEGHERLAGSLLARGRLAEAVEALFLRCFFAPDLGALGRLQELALRAGRLALAEEACLRAETVRGLLANPGLLFERAASLLAHAERMGDGLAAGAYRDFLSQGGPPEA